MTRPLLLGLLNNDYSMEHVQRILTLLTIQRPPLGGQTCGRCDVFSGVSSV